MSWSVAGGLCADGQGWAVAKVGQTAWWLHGALYAAQAASKAWLSEVALGLVLVGTLFLGEGTGLLTSGVPAGS